MAKLLTTAWAKRLDQSGFDVLVGPARARSMARLTDDDPIMDRVNAVSLNDKMTPDRDLLADYCLKGPPALRYIKFRMPANTFLALMQQANAQGLTMEDYCRRKVREGAVTPLSTEAVEAATMELAACCEAVVKDDDDYQCGCCRGLDDHALWGLEDWLRKLCGAVCNLGNKLDALAPRESKSAANAGNKRWRRIRIALQPDMYHVIDQDAMRYGMTASDYAWARMINAQINRVDATVLYKASQQLREANRIIDRCGNYTVVAGNCFQTDYARAEEMKTRCKDQILIAIGKAVMTMEMFNMA